MTTPQKFAGWRMVALAFLAQSFARGLPAGTFGPVIADLELRFGLSRGEVATAMSVTLLVMGLSAPAVGRLVTRLSVRRIMQTGAAIMSLAYFSMALATGFTQLMISFAFVGLGLCMLGMVSPPALVSRWFVSDRGKALGLANVPLFYLIVPFAAARIVNDHGSVGVFFAVGTTFAVLIPILFLVVDSPERIGQTAWKKESEESRQSRAVPENNAPVLGGAAFLKTWRFWSLTLGYGIVSAAGTMFMIHCVPFASQKGFPLTTAALVLSAYGAGGIVGTTLYGWIADRMGALKTLAMMSVILAAAYIGILQTSALIPMLILAALIGMTMSSLHGVHATGVNELFGTLNVATVMGLTYFFQLPFSIGTPPLAGHLYDITGSYTLPFTVHIVSFAVAVSMFSLIAVSQIRARRAASAV